MSSLSTLHFLRPLALLLLLAVPLFWLAWRGGRSHAGAWRTAVDAHLLPHLIERTDAGNGRAGAFFAAALWSLACIALAGPAWEREPVPLYRNQSARVLALELAPTMLAQDEKPTRLARARFKLEDILARSRDFQTALIGYAGDAFVAAPLTDDVGTVGNLIDALDPTTMPVQGNSTSRAIATASALIAQAGLHSGEIILIADSVGADALSAARKARAAGYTVSVLAVGSPSGAPVPLAQGDFLKDDGGNVVVARVDEASLRAVAEAGGGRYASLTADARDLDALLSDRVDAAGRSAPEGSIGAAGTAQSARWRDRGPWLLLLLAPLALLGFRRGWLMGIALALVGPAPRAEAFEMSDLWQRSDQQAAAALAKGDPKRAAEVADTPDWRGGAAYRAGDFDAAAADYATSETADGAYNRGNALAKAGRYDDALGAYDDALERDPHMDDASANRKAVEEFMKAQQNKSQPSKKGDKDSSGKDSKDKQKADPKSGEPKDQDKDPSKDKPGGQPGDPADSKDPKDDPPPADGQPPGSEGDQPSKQKPQDDAGKPPDDPSKDSKESSDGGGSEPKDPKAGDAPKPDVQQQQALSKEIDKALAGQPKPDAKDAKPAAAVPVEDDATREKKQALEHWLQRVPDDPGGLLRRKFQLEYQRRQQRAGEGG